MSTLDRTLAVDWVTESIYDTTKKTGADGNIDDLTSAFDGVTLLDETIVTEDGNTDVVCLQVQTHAANTRREFHHLLGYMQRLFYVVVERETLYLARS